SAKPGHPLWYRSCRLAELVAKPTPREETQRAQKSGVSEGATAPLSKPGGTHPPLGPNFLLFLALASRRGGSVPRRRARRAACLPPALPGGHRSTIRRLTLTVHESHERPLPAPLALLV